ncbi:MAG TPA: serine/threonine-protein kinase, partial [Baekduia sp.]|nr:serine/threonine-protein kinase [Baekduia sp.]
MRTVGRYEMLREIGRGGMATVYLARQPELRRLAALKELGTLRAEDQSMVGRFLHEARMAGSLNHPNIVTVYDYFEDGGTPYIAMEYVEGGSLRPLVATGLSLAQIGGVLEGVLAGLEAAARHGIVHRDLKPENLLVTEDGGIKITDFGIGKATLGLFTMASLTATGATMGTPAYMAPEQARGLDVTPQTDLYAAGIIAYELLAGRTPYADTPTPMAMLMRHVNDPPPPLGLDVEPALAAWVGRLLAKDPDARTPSATVAREDLDDLLHTTLGPRWRRDAPLPVDDAAAVVTALTSTPSPGVAAAAAVVTP